MSIGERLRLLRIDSKRTLKEQSGVFGVSLNTVYRWEHNLSMPRKIALNRIASHYKVSMGWLLLGNDEAAKSDADSDNLPGNDIESQILKMCRQLSERSKYKVLGYVERIYVEDIDKPK